MPERSSSEAILARLAALGNEFAEVLGHRVNEVRKLWAPVTQVASYEQARAALSQIHEIVHSLAGSGKSFGFPQVSTAAAPLDGLFRVLLEHRQPLTPEEIAQIELLVQDLERSSVSPREPITLDDIKAGAVPSTTERTSLRVIIAGSDANSENQALRDAIIKFGYGCDIAATHAQIQPAVLQGAPTVLFADISTTEDYLNAVRQGPVVSKLPLMAASAQSGFAERLKAVRLGAAMFVPKPYDMQDVINLLAGVEEAQAQRSYRVLIAEDEKSLALFYQMTLEHAGMEARIVNEPSRLLDAISGFDPDLILMDVYMSDSTGLELAQIVRQFPAYTTVPILFLSTESRLELQLQARHLGGDDFLVKPLKPSQLVSAVMSRANRYRDLKKTHRPR